MLGFTPLGAAPLAEDGVPSGPAGSNLSGTRYVDPDSFGSGAVAVGPITLTGTLYVNPDSFGSGTVVAAGPLQTLTGTRYTDPDVFGAGAVSAVAPVTGVNFVDPDSFGSGVVSLLSNTNITGALYVNSNTFYNGVVTNVGGLAALNPRVVVMRRLQPWKKKYKV